MAPPWLKHQWPCSPGMHLSSWNAALFYPTSAGNKCLSKPFFSHHFAHINICGVCQPHHRQKRKTPKQTFQASITGGGSVAFYSPPRLATHFVGNLITISSGLCLLQNILVFHFNFIMANNQLITMKVCLKIINTKTLSPSYWYLWYLICWVCYGYDL